MIKRHTIPTILGLVLLTFGTAAGVFLIQKGSIFFLRASPAIAPSQIKITNITNSSFTISWLTEDAVSGFAHFGETPALGSVAADDRDALSGTTGSFYAHYASLKNLKPKTKYYFKLGSGGKTFDNSGKPWEITTASTPGALAPSSDIASGTVLNQDQTPAEGAILYLSIDKMTPQSALIRSSGNWLISLNNAFSSDLSGFASYDKDAQVVEIFVQGGKQTATAITTTKNDNPIPEIVLGQTYDFRKEEVTTQEAPPTQEATEAASASEEEISSKFSFEELGQATEETTTLSISNPEEGENLNTQKPAFSGTGPAGETIQILVESLTTYNDSVAVDSEGNWTWTPPDDLESGEHSLTLTYLGETITRRFTVLAAGASDLPSFTATPSATTTPTLTPTPTATATPTPSVATRTALPSTEGGVPAVGYLTPTFLVFILGLVLVLAGVITKKVLAHA